MPNPYILMPQQAQDMSGLQPVYQNMAAQQQFQNQMAQQGNQLAQQAGQTASSGMNPMALAAALRKDNQKGGSLSDFKARVDMAVGSEASPFLKDQVNQLGSNTWNPLSNYNMGTNGWGNYGE